MTRRVNIVPHTHWDREWYSPFQTFRLRLIDMLDEFLPRLEADPSYARFLLDGQMAVVDDYLEARPEAEDTLRRLAAAGRLSVGPWYILMDEFLVSGETIVRDLQLGFERAAAFGGAMPVGYLPDMFGHIGQMPQILRLAGIEHAVVWRGVPAAVDRTAFWWTAPDGSTVRAEYLMHGYSNGSSIPDDAKALLKRIQGHADDLGDALVGDLLFMNGTDHEAPQPWLGRVIAEVNDLQDDYELVVTSLVEHVSAGPSEGLPSWTGELRSGARANMLMGVASNRVDVKQAAARAERALEHLAEPLCALFLPPEQWPRRLLDLAWREMIRNAAHDSICACSTDDVGLAVLHRYAEARHIAEGLADRATAALGRSMARPGTVVVNPSPRSRSGLVEIRLPGDGPLEGAQVVSVRRADWDELTLDGAALTGLLGHLHTQQIGEHTFVNRVEVSDDDDAITVVLHADSRLRTVLRMDEIKADLVARVEARPDVPVKIRLEQPVMRRVLVLAENVPAYGWTRWEAEAPTVPLVEASGGVLRNGLVELVVDASDGTFSINGHAGLGRLVDDGDAGDTYNYSPPSEDAVIDVPEAVSVETLEAGPLRGRLAVRRRYTWPTGLDGQRRSGSTTVDVDTVLELRAGEAFVRVHTSFHNPSRDHRVRVWFPLAEPASGSRAECAFGTVERALEAEGGPTEQAMPTFPSRRFVQAGGLTVAHEGLLEYELVDGGRALALTLLRATGMLSRVDVATRPLPAGPPVPADAAQMVGRVEADYVVHIGDADPYALVDDAFLPLLTVNAPGGGEREDRGSALTVDGAQVSAVRRHPGGLEVRVFNPTDEETTVDLGARSGWLVDLRGRAIAPFSGRFGLRAHGIATARL
jgi:mannosylglycerate hydrolase